MWQEILKQKADFAGFFRDFEKNKIAELAKDDGEGWLNIIPIAKKYGLSDSAVHFLRLKLLGRLGSFLFSLGSLLFIPILLAQ